MTALVPKLAGALAALALFGCGSPVPDGMYLTLSVNAQGLAVAGAVNGKPNDFISGDTGMMAGSMPLNKFVREGENEVSFTLKQVSPDGAEFVQSSFQAVLEVSAAGEMVDTNNPGERVMFERSLNAVEQDSLMNGNEITITETFIVDPAALRAMAP